MIFNFGRSTHANIKNISFLLISFCLLSILLLTGCAGVKLSGVKSGKKLYEVFYVGEKGDQYFIKPIRFQHTSSKEEVSMDFSFRYKDEIKDSVIINFSLFSPTVFKKLDGLTLSSSEGMISTQRIELLFNEKTKKEYNSRFTTKISLESLHKLFSGDKWELTLDKGEDQNTYVPERKARKALRIINERIFILF